ncbi:MAG: O-antigen ligase family protein [Candidatus Magasanikbacteria bacterium]|jgi:hypothetical protein
MIRKIIFWLSCLLLFFLPLQTRWVYEAGNLNGGFFEYGTMSLYATEILAWLIIFLSFIARLRDRDERARIFSGKYFRERWPRLVYFFVGLLLVGFLVARSLDFWVSYQYVTRLLGVVCVAIVIAQLAGAGGGRKLLIAFWAGGVAQGILAIVQFLSQNAFKIKGLGMAPHSASQIGDFVLEIGSGRWLRAYGNFGSPNSLGIYLAVALVAGLILLFYQRQDNEKNIATQLGSEDSSHSPACRQARFGMTTQKIVWLTAGQLVILSGLVFSFSRGAWIAALVGLASLVILSLACRQAGVSERSFCHNYRILARQFLYYFILVSILITIFSPLFFSRFDLSNRLEAHSFTERVNQISVSYKLSAQNLFFGVGPGVYTQAIYMMRPDLPVWSYQPVHNIYMLLVVEWGVGVFLLSLWALGRGVILVWKNNRIFLPVILVVLVAGLFDHWIMSMWSGLLLTGVVGGLRICHSERSPKEA